MAVDYTVNTMYSILSVEMYNWKQAKYGTL